MKSLFLLAVLVSACSRDHARNEEPAGAAVVRQAPDTMVLRLPDSAEVWLVGSMLDTAATGEPCELRTVEIRRASSRTPVPLLHTLGRLEVVDDTTVMAALVRDCAKYDTYLVNTKTGQPRRAK